MFSAQICLNSFGPIQKRNISELKKVRRSAARFVKNDHTSTISKMLEELGWSELLMDSTTNEYTVVVFCKIVFNNSSTGYGYIHTGRLQKRSKTSA